MIHVLQAAFSVDKLWSEQERKKMTATMLVNIAQPVPAKNGKSALLCLDHAPWIQTFGTGKSTPFRPNSFDEGEHATRVTCSINAEGDLATWAQQADEAILAVVCAKPLYYLGKEMSEDAIRAAYCPLYRTHEKYAASLKVKVNRVGVRATRFWTIDGARTTEPEDWTCVTFAPRLWLKSIWITPGAQQWGVSTELTDCQVTEISQSCPFPFEAAETDPFA